MKRRLASLIIGALTVGSGALVALSSASAASDCAVEMQDTEYWHSWRRGAMRVVSFGRPVTQWTVQFDLTYQGQMLKRLSGASWEQRGTAVTIRGGGLQSDVPLVLDYLMTAGFPRSAPRAITLNGVPCDSALPLPPQPTPPTALPTPSIPPTGTPTPFSPSPPPDPNRPVVSFTSPRPYEYFLAGATVPLDVTVTPYPGRQVTKVEFAVVGAGAQVELATDTTAPYSYDWVPTAPGDYLFYARAYDDTGARTFANSARFRVLTPGGERAAPYVAVVGNQLWGISQFADEAAHRTLAPLERRDAASRCARGQGIWDGEVDSAAVEAMAARGVRAVYVTANDRCWLGLPGIDPRYGGEAYQQEVFGYTQRLAAAGITPILALDGGGRPMPDARTAPRFWSGVAELFDGRDTAVFDLFSAPHPDSRITDQARAWTCWRDGGTACAPLGYPVAGMRTLMDALRVTSWWRGVVVAAGMRQGTDLSGWLRYRPADEFLNLAAGWAAPPGATCRNPALAPVAAEVPVVVTRPCVLR